MISRKPYFFALVFGTILLLFGCKDEKLQKAGLALKLGDYLLAEEFYREILRDNPADFSARVGLGKALVQKAVADPSDNSLWEKAMIQFEAARSLQASENIDRLVAESYVEHSRRLLSSGDTLQALEFLTKAIQTDSKPVQSLNLAGIIYSRMGQMQRAEVLFEKAVELDSTHASALFNLGMLRWQQQKTEEAHLLWMSALRIIPDN